MYNIKTGICTELIKTPVLESAGAMIILVFEMPPKRIIFFSNNTFSIHLINTKDATGNIVNIIQSMNTDNMPALSKQLFDTYYYVFFVNSVLLLLFVFVVLFWFQWEIISITFLLTIKDFCLLLMSLKLSLFIFFR